MHRDNITLMWGWSALLGLLLFLPAHSTQCSNDVPADCEFNQNVKFCGWEHHNWKRDPSNDGYAFLEGGALSGYMKSKERCVSSHISHCLKFRFRLKRNETDNLSVSIVWPEKNMTLVLWNYSSQKVKCTDAKVPVCSDSNFQLVINARSPNPGRTRDISVDRFKYETDSCDIEPISAKPPTATATSSSKTGIIIGIVLAVIGAVVFGVVVCIVIRRRRNPLMALLSARMKNHQEDSGNHNPAVVSVGENCNEVNTTNCPDSSTPRICSGMSNGDYSVIDDIQTKDVTSSAFQPITSLYSKAKVLHSVHREDSKSETRSPDANPYDLIDEELGVCQARGASLTVEYNILAIHKTAVSLPQPTQTGGVYHVLGHDTHVTESGTHATGVYHILKETETRNATEKEMSSHPGTCLSEGAKGDYQSLDRIPPQGTKAEQSWDLASVTFTSDQGRPISDVYEISPDGANNGRQRDYQDASSVLQTSTTTHGRLDCTDAESDRSVHTGLRVDSPAQQSAGGASVYKSLQAHKGVHVYCQMPGVYQN